MATGGLPGSYPSIPTTPARSSAALTTSRRTSASGGRGQAVEKQKGLKLFSTKVCEKVRQKGKTTYNEVADELVQEVQEERQGLPGDQGFDQKNIRRRVYDALNVLMAIHIIAKEKKEIRWIGLPTNSASECAKLEEEKRGAQERIARKKRELQDVLLQQIAFSNLVERNKSLPQDVPAAPNSSVRLPFLLLKTSKNTVIECSISNDRTEYSFDFDRPYEILSDADVMNMMRMSMGLADGTCTEEEVARARELVPKRFVQYIDELFANKCRQPVCAGDPAATAVTATAASISSSAQSTAASASAFGPAPLAERAAALAPSLTPQPSAGVPAQAQAAHRSFASQQHLRPPMLDNGLDHGESSEESVSVD